VACVGDARVGGCTRNLAAEAFGIRTSPRARRNYLISFVAEGVTRSQFTQTYKLLRSDFSSVFCQAGRQTDRQTHYYHTRAATILPAFAIIPQLNISNDDICVQLSTPKRITLITLKMAGRQADRRVLWANHVFGREPAGQLVPARTYPQPITYEGTA
jgi:hypothetical protein